MIKLGDKAQCRVSGFKGIVTARCEYLNGCVHFCIAPRVDEEGKIRDSQYIDEGQLDIVKRDAFNRSKKKSDKSKPASSKPASAPGGPSQYTPQ